MSWSFAKARWGFLLSSTRRMEFYDDFADALHDGASTHDHLKKLATRAKQRRHGLGVLYKLWLEKMERMTFSHALRHSAPDHEVMVLTAAEEDARLPEGMLFLVKSLKMMNAIRAAYLKSLLSPTMGAVALLGLLTVYATQIAPAMVDVLPYGKWPPISATFYAISNFLVQHTSLLGLSLVLVYALVKWSFPSWNGRLRAQVEHIPFLPWKNYRERQAISFLVTLATLLQGKNHGPVEALKRMRELASPWLAWHINLMLNRMKLTPHRPASALDTGFFDRRLMDRIEDYSERSEFPAALNKLAFERGDKFVQQADKKAAVVGFIAMGIVAGVIIAFVAANFEMSQAVQNHLTAIRK